MGDLVTIINNANPRHSLSNIMHWCSNSIIEQQGQNIGEANKRIRQDTHRGNHESDYNELGLDKD